MQTNNLWGSITGYAASYSNAADKYNNDPETIESGEYAFPTLAINLLGTTVMGHGSNQYYLKIDAEIQRQINATNTGLATPNKGGGLIGSINSLNTALGAFALGRGELQFTYEAIVVSETNATFSNISRISKLRGLGRSAGVLEGLQAVGKIANYAALGVVVGKVLYNQEVKPSDVLDGVIGGAAFIPG